MALTYQIVTFAGNSTVSLFHRGKAYIANMDHPSWDKILEKVKAGDESVVDLFDIAGTVNREFKRLSGRYTVENGRVHLDGDPMDNSFTKKVLEVLASGQDNWGPLVKFGENILSNPSEYSRSQLYDFLEHNIFAINEDGLIVGYKGVATAHGHDKQYHSVRSGATPVSVNDEEAKTGHVYQSIGDSVFMARSLVDDNAGEMCGAGLHVSTYDYALSYGDTVLNVLVHPANVVSVPKERGYHKIRVNAYTVLGVSEGQHTEPVVVTGKAPEPVLPEPEVEGNIEEQKVRLSEKGYWQAARRAKFYLPNLGFNPGDVGTVTEPKGDEGFEGVHKLFKRGYDGAEIYLHESSFLPLEDTPAQPTFTKGSRVSLRSFKWNDLDGNPVVDSDYFRDRDVYLGSTGKVAENQLGALSASNVKVDFDNDWTIWVAPDALSRLT